MSLSEHVGGEGVNVAMSASVNIHRGGAQASDAHWVPHTREKGKMESSGVFENPDSVTNQIYLGGADRSRRSRSNAGQAVVSPPKRQRHLRALDAANFKAVN